MIIIIIIVIIVIITLLLLSSSFYLFLLLTSARVSIVYYCCYCFWCLLSAYLLLVSEATGSNCSTSAQHEDGYYYDCANAVTQSDEGWRPEKGDSYPWISIPLGTSKKRSSMNLIRGRLMCSGCLCPEGGPLNMVLEFKDGESQKVGNSYRCL